MIKDVYDFILQVLFPLKCIGCKKIDSYICEECILKIPYPIHEKLENIEACFDYQNPLIKKAIWDLKYYNKRHVAILLGNLLYEHNKEDISELRILHNGEPIIVIPVPLSKDREKERGYNQSEQIAKYFIKNQGKNIFELRTDIITKTKDTGHQARIRNKKIRIKNMIGAFTLNKDINLKNRVVFVVDDVTTTGATITEILKLLKKSGVGIARGITIAH